MKPTRQPCQLADITILVDGSDSITRHQWKEETLPAVVSWMEGYWRDSKETQITVVQFSDTVETIFGPATRDEDDYWRDDLLETEQLASSTNLNQAIEDVTSESFYRMRAEKLASHSTVSLDSRFRMLFVLSDGWPTEDLELSRLAKSVNKRFDIIAAVGVGPEADLDTLKEVMDQLQFTQDQVHLSTVADYSRLTNQMPRIHMDVCELEQRLILGRKKRAIGAAPQALLRKKRQLTANRGPRPDELNFSAECNESGFCNCKCTTPVIELEGRQGPPGDRGLDGKAGEDGPDGQDGDDGAPGRDGRDGQRGIQGEKGNRGEDGGEGNDGEKGAKGAPGRDGKQGRQGEQGPAGRKPQQRSGGIGDPGQVGECGEDGEQGPRGRSGPGGDAGPPGQEGDDGEAGEPGDQGPDGSYGEGVDGDCGEAGYSGKAGSPGRNGDDGQDGQDGVDGQRGPAGDAGHKGQPGSKGNKGADGDPGECGRPGNHGEDGDQGEKGERGDAGVDGHNGQQGPKGPRGLDGVDGAVGQTGAKGYSGLNGNVGRPGMPGNDGDEGDEGDQGEDGDDGPIGAPGDHGDEGAPGQKGSRGNQGRPGTVDLEQYYAQIKEMVRAKMYPNGCPAKCKSKKPVDEPTPSMIPLNAVFLVDGSDSIRSGEKKDEWIMATRAIQETVDALDVRYFSLVQFSQDTIDHIENFDIAANGKAEAKREIESELRDAQMKDTTNTYQALQHVADMQFEDSNSQSNVLFLITDGEPRDDTDNDFVQEVLIEVREQFDYVFVAVIGEEMRQAVADYSRIQGRIETSPIYVDDYQSMARRLVPHFTRTSTLNQERLMRMKRHLKKRSIRPKRRMSRHRYDQLMGY